MVLRKYDDIQLRLNPLILKPTEIAQSINIMAHPTLTFGISSMHIPKLRLNKIIAKEKNYLKMKSTLNRSTNNGIINSRLGIGLNDLGDKMDKEKIRAFEFVIISRNDD